MDGTVPGHTYEGAMLSYEQQAVLQARRSASLLHIVVEIKAGKMLQGYVKAHFPHSRSPGLCLHCEISIHEVEILNLEALVE